MKQKQGIPTASLDRLSIYYRELSDLATQQITRIRSHELGDRLKIDPATIRRDLSYIGELGRNGYGYDVQQAQEALGHFLEVDQIQALALVGVGNLGRAMLQNNFRRNPNIKIVVAFDHDPTLVGTIINGVHIYDPVDFKVILPEFKIESVISTVPSRYSQEVADHLVSCGVTSLLCFAPKRLAVPANVQVRYIDLSSVVQSMLVSAHYAEKD